MVLEIWRALFARFRHEEIRERPGPGGTKVKYITSRTVENRLDDVLGPENWENDYTATSRAIVCHLTVKMADGTKITKAGVGYLWSETEMAEEVRKAIEKNRAAVSPDLYLERAVADADKRAARKFGIGRYLYSEGLPAFMSQRPFAGEEPLPSQRPPPERPPVERPLPAPAQPPPVTQAADQDFRWQSVMPRPGTSEVSSWLSSVGHHFGVDLLGMTRKLCVTENLPQNYNQWDAKTVATMIGRIVNYLSKRQDYKNEFNGLSYLSIDGDIKALQRSCWSKAVSLLAAAGGADIVTDGRTRQIISDLSKGAIPNVMECHDATALKSVLSELEVQLGSLPTSS